MIMDWMIRAATSRMTAQREALAPGSTCFNSASTWQSEKGRGAAERGVGLQSKVWSDQPSSLAAAAAEDISVCYHVRVAA